MSTTTRLLQLASPALPVGAYSYSQGLEWAIECGDVHHAASAQRWIEDHLELVVARFEAPVYAACHRAWLVDDAVSLHRLNAEFRASRESAEPRAETVQVGFSYAAWCRDVAPLSDTQRATLDSINSVTAPVVASLAAAASGLTTEEGLTAYLFGIAENQVMVLAKALPMGQIAAQKLLFGLSTPGRAVEAAVRTATALSEHEDNWSSASPWLAIAQMKHETQYTRLFRS
ncbi:MAG: urease accessory protein UreF [Burkholderiales bacterium]|nr:urease accessory protein UreF [Burkholderiales bacterium]